MSRDQAAVPQLDHVLICHREPLIGAATAALIESSGIARHTSAVDSIAHLLSRLGRPAEVAVVFDSVGEDVSDLFEAMHHRGLGTPVLVVTASADARYAAGILEAGAAGLVHAWCRSEELHESILDAQAGQVVIPSVQRAEILEALRMRRLERLEARQRLARLTTLDVRILSCLCDGLTVARIAERLLLSPHTVRGHVRAIGGVIGARGQLGIAAAGRQLLAAAKLPLGGEMVPVSAPSAGRTGAGQSSAARLSSV